MKLKTTLAVLPWALTAIIACTVSYLHLAGWVISIVTISLVSGFLEGVGRNALFKGIICCLLATICACFNTDAPFIGLALGGFLLWGAFGGTGLQAGSPPTRDPWSIFIE